MRIKQGRIKKKKEQERIKRRRREKGVGSITDQSRLVATKLQQPSVILPDPAKRDLHVLTDLRDRQHTVRQHKVRQGEDNLTT